MACCIVAALVLALTGRLTPWRRRPNLDAGFAPVATRPAAPTGPPSPAIRRTAIGAVLPRRRAALGWFLRFAALATTAYLVCSALAVWSGLAISAAPRQEWLIRTLVLALVAVAAGVYGSRTLSAGTDASSRSQIVGYGLAAGGVVALELMMLDMHVLALYHLPHGFGHNLFQVLCVLAIGTGALLAGDIRTRQLDTTPQLGRP